MNRHERYSQDYEAARHRHSQREDEPRYGARDSWEDPAFRRNPHRIYRIPQRGWLTGVCAGVADYYGFSPLLVRLMAIFSWAIPTLGLLVTVAWVVASFALPRRPEQPYRDPDEERFWRAVSKAPGDTFGELRHKLRSQEHRLRRMEAYVTSTQYEIDRELHRSERN